MRSRVHEVPSVNTATSTWGHYHVIAVQSDCQRERMYFMIFYVHGIQFNLRIQATERLIISQVFLLCDAMLSAVYAVVVCLPVTLRYCIKTAKCRITQITPHDSQRTLVH